MILCMSIEPGLLRPGIHAGGDRRASRSSPALVDVPIQVDGGIGEANAKAVRDAGASLLVAGNAVFADPDPGAAYARIRAAAA